MLPETSVRAKVELDFSFGLHAIAQMEGVSLWLKNKMSCLSLLSFIPSLFLSAFLPAAGFAFPECKTTGG